MFLIYAWLSLWLHFFVHNSESLEAEKYMMSTCPPINEIKVAFVTAITGTITNTRNNHFMDYFSPNLSILFCSS